MKSIKIMIMILVLIVAGFLLYYMNYQNDYSVNNTESDLQVTINNRLNTEVVLELTENTDNKLHVLFRVGNSVGVAELKKGWNSRYKLLFASLGTDAIEIRKVDTSKGSYLFMAGRNDVGIKKIVTTVYGENNVIEMPDTEYFLVKEPIKEFSHKHPPYIILVDEYGKEIRKINLTL